jgi:sensor histidine kinase YesM
MSSLAAALRPSEIDAPPQRQSISTPPSAQIRSNGLLVIALASGALALATASECRSIFHPASVMYGAALWGWWGCIAAALWKLSPRHPSILRFSRGTILVHLGASCALAVLHLVLMGSLGFTVAGWRAHYSALAILKSQLHINRFGLEILTYGFVFGIIGIIQFQIRSQRDAMKALALQKQLSEAQLRALQMQLEPHFLFNTLNAVTTLVELGRQREATEMLTHLNTILKSTLSRRTPEKVPLSQELETVENYLAIEQIRFADRLRIEIKVEPSALNSLVPCFLLQPIVENAIRHGIAQSENEGCVEASARRVGQVLQLCVRNTGDRHGRRAHDGHGIGLSNTRERLMHFYQDTYNMTAQALEAGGFEVAISIPYERR